METTTEKKDWKTLACLIAFGALLLAGIFYGGYANDRKWAEYKRHQAELAERFAELDCRSRHCRGVCETA